MTGRWRKAARSSAAPLVVTRGDWRSLITLARECVADARDAASKNGAGDRLVTLGARSRRARFDLLDREAGATTTNAAKALIALTEAFTAPVTASETRREMVSAIEAVADLLEDRLHTLATQDFQRAHAGRPEVWR